MFKQLVEFVTSLLCLARDTKENRDAMVRMQKEMHELTGMVEKISAELKRVKEREKNEREKLLLKIENAFLRLENQRASKRDAAKTLADER